jgi:hypothetical protein
MPTTVGTQTIFGIAVIASCLDPGLRRDDAH